MCVYLRAKLEVSSIILTNFRQVRRGGLIPSTSQKKPQNANPDARLELTTCNRTDLNKFRTRKSFGNYIENLFNKGHEKVNVVQWTCCKEQYQDGADHYHIAIRCEIHTRWKLIKEKFRKTKYCVAFFR